jgi:hypothetical protein
MCARTERFLHFTPLLRFGFIKLLKLGCEAFSLKKPLLGHFFYRTTTVIIIFLAENIKEYKICS